MNKDLDYLGDAQGLSPLQISGACTGVRSIAQAILCLMTANSTNTREFAGSLLENLRGSNMDEDITTHHASMALSGAVDYMNSLGYPEYIEAKITDIQHADNSMQITIAVTYGNEQDTIISNIDM